MYLTFEVISANAAALGAGRRKVFTVDGGRLGRSPENDMVLPGVGVHRHHATVRFINGVFFVEGVGTNGIAINDPERVLPRNEPYPLKAGDKVFIDEYELVVSTSAAPPAPIEAGARPAARATTPVASEPLSTDPRLGPAIVGNPAESAEDLDPLRKLTGGATTPPSRPQRMPDASWNHTSSLSDHFSPPPAPAAPPPSHGAASVIPENWDRTSFDRSKLQPPSPTPPPAPQAASAPAPKPTPRAPVTPTPAAVGAAHAATIVRLCLIGMAFCARREVDLDASRAGNGGGPGTHPAAAWCRV